MPAKDDVTASPAFQQLLRHRYRWRWGLSGLLIGAYFVWAVGGIYFAESYARPLPGTAIPQGIAAGLLIILISIALSILYVRAINRLEARLRIGSERRS